jgi:hypothetical protein
MFSLRGVKAIIVEYRETYEELKRVRAQVVELEASAQDGGDPFAWCFTDVNGKPTDFADNPIHKSANDLRTYTALYTRPPSAVVPEWVKRSVRLPTVDDADCDLAVWVSDSAFHRPKYAQKRVHYETVESVEEYTHWMPTGMKRPAPPRQEQES